MSIVEKLKGLFTLEREYSEEPVSIRAAKHPDGKVRIQGAYVWSEGLSSGIVWKDLPLVNVDENGEEIV